MSFFSNTRPNLIGNDIKRTVNKIMKKQSNNTTISDKISFRLGEFYKNYIEENKFYVFIFFIIIIFLIYRYYNRSGKKENYSNQDYEKLKDIIYNQTAHLRYDDQPTIDRLRSIDDQPRHDKVYYPPDPLPVNIPGKGIIYTRNIYDDPEPYPALNTPKYNYNNVYENKSRSYYNGTYDTYQNAQDTDIPNPLGYPNNFNTTTGDYIKYMTNTNEKYVMDYQNILDKANLNLVDSLKIGPKYLNTKIPEFEMEPPYATDNW